jgi:hypothetical protein
MILVKDNRDREILILIPEVKGRRMEALIHIKA